MCENHITNGHLYMKQHALFTSGIWKLDIPQYSFSFFSTDIENKIVGEDCNILNFCKRSVTNSQLPDGKNVSWMMFPLNKDSDLLYLGFRDGIKVLYLFLLLNRMQQNSRWTWSGVPTLQQCFPAPKCSLTLIWQCLWETRSLLDHVHTHEVPC